MGNDHTIEKQKFNKKKQINSDTEETVQVSNKPKKASQQLVLPEKYRRKSMIAHEK